MAVFAAKQFRTRFSQSGLVETYLSRVSLARAIGLDRVDAKNFSSRLGAEAKLISEKILSGKFQFTKYKEKLISKGAGKFPRVLSIPTIRDRLVHRALCDYLFEVFPEAKPDLPQTKVDLITAAIDSGAHKYFVKIDLKDFYPSIPHDRLLSRLRSRARLPQFVSLVGKAIRTPTVPESNTDVAHSPDRGVPQGLSISNVLAEIYMLGIDRKIRSVAPAYFRFVDDIVVLTDSEPEKLCRDICDILRAAKLTPHRIGDAGSKTRVGELGKGFDFLGYSIRPKRISIREGSIRGFEGSLVGVFTEYKHRLRAAVTPADKEAYHRRFLWLLNLRITGCIFREKRYGWIFYFSQINDLSVLRRIDNTINLLLKRFKVAIPPRPKRALKSFYEAKRVDKTAHLYIPNYDAMTPPKMRKFLMELGFKVDSLPDLEVLIAFNKVIRRATRRLEEDISHIS